MTTTADLLLASSTLTTGTALEHIQNLGSGTGENQVVLLVTTDAEVTTTLAADLPDDGSSYPLLSANVITELGVGDIVEMRATSLANLLTSDNISELGVSNG